ncbi:Uncharacterized conserved protein, DUF2236 family [Rhodococcus triatomae]|uniref:Uncharacterized conserved protein, DUF2236 family n=1 Tax=Rhodococcus triatomae TaxID=300028 RepID=A0A1G7ZTM7_9NOCA|nr:oxygenase MpaB family protein [Rhodococcus triatomae]SDH12024.1 Uncharacterized conserved protein, DUF2236 family [Rhodococcus triatomae]
MNTASSTRDRRMRKAKTQVEPPEDYGFFGPDSITWKVWGYPTSLTVGFQRAVVIEELDPFLIAAVDDTGKIYTQPRIRYDHTLRYFAIAAFADSRTATKAAEILVKVHGRAFGTEPISGNAYDANDPGQQLWIHLTAWHSILYAYEMYGPGKLTPEEEGRYWDECAIAAELQTCDPADIPRTREGIREYFARERPRLAASEAAQAMMHQLLDAKVMFPPVPWFLRPGAWVVSRTLRAATIATMPAWQRALGGLHQPRIVDRLLRPLMTLVFWMVAQSNTAQLLLLRWISPSTYPVVEPVLRPVLPRRLVTTTPAEAFRRHGVDTPVDAYRKLLDRRTASAERSWSRHTDEQWSNLPAAASSGTA